MGAKDQNTTVLESEVFDPSQQVIETANVKEYDQLYKRSIEDREGFWAEQADELDWYQKWDTVLDDSNKPFYKWFVGGKFNIIHNAIDRLRAHARRRK